MTSTIRRSIKNHSSTVSGSTFKFRNSRRRMDRLIDMSAPDLAASIDDAGAVSSQVIRGNLRQQSVAPNQEQAPLLALLFDRRRDPIGDVPPRPWRDVDIHPVAIRDLVVFFRWFQSFNCDVRQRARPRPKTAVRQFRRAEDQKTCAFSDHQTIKTTVRGPRDHDGSRDRDDRQQGRPPSAAPSDRIPVPR